jgi:hypothetical protein
VIWVWFLTGRKLLELIPKGVVYGILTFVGLAGILPESENQFSKRLLLLFTAPTEFPADETSATVLSCTHTSSPLSTSDHT